MTATVVLDLACCSLGRAPECQVRVSGGKAVVATTAPHRRGDEQTEVASWSWQVADLVGTRREAVLAGCPVPLAAELSTWVGVAAELDADRWDAIVVPVPPARVGDLLDAPALALRILDARLASLAPLVGTQPAAAKDVARLLALRPRLLSLRAVADAAVGAGSVADHARLGCDRPGGIALGWVDPADLAGSGAQGTGVRRAQDELVWWAWLGSAAEPDLCREDDRLLVRVGSELRTLTLPPALVRCQVVDAVVVVDRLEVRFRPDPEAWR